MGNKSRMQSYGAGVLKSTDLGETWTDLRNDVVDTPTLYDHRIAIPPLDQDVRVNSITLDSSDMLWALTMNQGMEDDTIWLNRWSGQDWQTLRLDSCLPDNRVAVEGMMTMDVRDGLHIVLTAAEPSEVGNDSHWGHPSCEVFHLCSDDGGETFECSQVSPTDPTVASWHASITLPGPCHPVDTPAILYTHGHPGEGLRPDTQTEVWLTMVR